MPLYDFKCKDCSDIVETFKPVSCKVIPCPSCKGDMDRLMSTKVTLTIDMSNVRNGRSSFITQPTGITSDEILDA